MRIEVEFHGSKGQFTVPINYNQYITGLIYNIISGSSRNYANFLHNEGYEYNRENTSSKKQFKLFTYSQLYLEDSKLIGKEIISKKGKGRLYISSPITEFMEHLANGLLTQQEVRIHRERLKIGRIKKIDPPAFHGNMDFLCLSPIVSSTMVKRNGRLSPYYYRYEDEGLQEALKNNLKKKHYLVKGEKTNNDDLKIKFDKDYVNRNNSEVSKLINFKGIKVKGIFAPFTLRGSPDLMEMAYKAGLGEKGSIGCGMIDVT